MLYPYRFAPVLVKRVWGGSALARFGKSIPAGAHIGESWEISDRPEAQSVVVNGPDQGQTLRQLCEQHGSQLLGANAGAGPAARFPLLVKLLDARERLSLQVHPPAAIATGLGGETKTEMWYVLEAAPKAHLIAGLRHGTTRAQFETALIKHHPPLIDLVHRFPIAANEAFFVPAGRLHAIDAGVVLVEIQQNSDTTYRVSDWGRVGLDGQPRALHIQQSLACIDFNDFEPAKVNARSESRGANRLARLVECPEFGVHQLVLHDPWADVADGATFHIIACVAGQVGLRTVGHPEERLATGDFILLPAALGAYTVAPLTQSAAALKAFLPG